MKSILFIYFFLVPALAFGGELGELHRAEMKRRFEEEKASQKSKEGKEGPVRSEAEADANQQGVTEIGLERVWGGISAYTVIIKSDGTFKYTGEVGVEKLGEHTGAVSTDKMGTLLQLAKASKFHSFQLSYTPSLSSPYDDIVYTMVKLNGKTKVVSNDEKSGPSKLLAIEQVIDDLLLTAKWDHKLTREEKLDELRQLAKEGDSRAAAILSYRYLTGFGVVFDVRRAFSYAETSAAKKDPLGIYCLSHCYREGLGIPKDKNKAIELARLALPGLETEVKSRDAWVQFALGKSYFALAGLKGGMDYRMAHSKAVEFYTKAAEQGNAAAQAELGFCYQYGRGVPRSETRAAEFYAEAADQDNAMAQRSLAYLHKLGSGVSKSSSKSFELYTKAAELGDGLAQVMLANLYLHGSRGVPKDEARAAELYAMVARQDGILQGSAQRNIANLYATGRGVPKNEAKAIDLYAKAGENGDEGAYYKLANIYLSKKDSERAIEIFNKFRPSIFGNLDKAEREKITTLYNDSGFVPPWVRVAVENVNDPDSKANGGPSTKEIMAVLGRKEMNALFLDQLPKTPKREIKRGKSLKSVGGDSIPDGLIIYPVHLKVPIIQEGFVCFGNRPTTEKVYYFFKNESEDWEVTEKPE